MTGRLTKPFLLLGALVLIVGLACNAVFGGDPTPPPEPTRTLEPTRTSEPTPTPEPTLQSTATSTPPPPSATIPAQPTGTADPSVPFSLSDEPYAHPEGIFELLPPRGWSMSENDGSVLFEAEDESGAIYFQVTNTGYALDPASFENFVLAREANFFGTYENYAEVEQSIEPEDGFASVSKQLDFDGIPQFVVSFYDQREQAVFALDFWADSDRVEAYADQYDAIFESAMVDGEAAALQDIYYWVYEFYGPGDLFVIEVPTAWEYELTTGEFTVVDTFYAPDDHAVIQNITYDDGEPVSKSEAGAFALELLRTFYAEDIEITDDEVQPDGSERLIWHSPSGEYTGITFFESRGTPFLLFTSIYDNAFEDVYFDVLDYTIGSYVVP